MRILNLEGTYFLNEFKKAGHHVLSIGYDDICDLKLEKFLMPLELINFLKAKNFFPDIVVWNDVCKPPAILGFELLPCLTIGFSIDQYCNPWHVPFSACFDLFLVAQKDYLSIFKQNNEYTQIEWLPLFFDPKRAFDSGGKRDIPISFVGTLDGVYNRNRRSFLEACQKKLPLVILQGNYQPIYSRSKIVLNQSAAGELNFRIFEAAACGAVVLTEDVENGLRDLFEIEKEIVVYKRDNVKSAVKKAKEILKSDRLEKIALAGKEKVYKYHQVKNRVEFILTKAKNLLSLKAYKKRLCYKQKVLQELAKVFYFLSLDEEINIPITVRKDYFVLAKKIESMQKL
ncbi:Glycosyl transferases group 1 [Desulfonauticus submarinus]|uniref:Glycosyl transferases group 1 n=1 Tax=Desulfonauticus submarinus TaxID=206665 RepID=A0A1H0DMT9_9BACT|nr:glycosyltransferase [Desulfonauticus submarinus]SDN71462.1 Glycosyl transferases group 1 [Desulfonauticus submarinus]